MTTIDMPSKRRARRFGVVGIVSALVMALMTGLGSQYWYWIVAASLCAAFVTYRLTGRWVRGRHEAGKINASDQTYPSWAYAVNSVVAASGVFVANMISGGIQAFILAFGSCVLAFGAAVCLRYAELIAPNP